MSNEETNTEEMKGIKTRKGMSNEGRHEGRAKKERKK
jgi:hypothetical protein